MTDTGRASSAPDRLGGRGQVCIWPGGSLWIGTALRPADLHAHHAIQIAFAFEGTIRFREGAEGEWIEYTGCVIPPDIPHAFDGRGRGVAHVFVDPESAEGQRIRARAGAGSIASLPGPETRECSSLLRDAWARSHECTDLVPAARHVVERLAGPGAAHHAIDPRVLGAIELIRARLDGRVSLTDVAADLNISPSRLRHLFADEVGLPFRSYVLWERLQRVLRMAPGGTLTEAALAAGFADAAHMTRTFRRMFGMAPSAFERE